MLRYQSLFCDTADDHRLHIMHISRPSSHGVPILMIHGMVEDGRIFYHKSGKGLGSYLADKGYDVYAADLRGIGKSTPSINKQSRHGQTETITQDLPRLINFVLEKTGAKKLSLIAHSWGGVNLNACLLRFPELVDKIVCSAYFGSKRTVRARTFDRYFKVSLVWNRMSFSLAKRAGYLPAVKYKLGSQNETRKTHEQCVRWVKNRNWVDSDDGFDYGKAAKEVVLPPTLYFAAIKDTSLGHRFDVKNFIQESGDHSYQYELLAKRCGNKRDYDHIDMLTAPECIDDHFPFLVKWLVKHI